MTATPFEKLLFPESPDLTPYTVIERFEYAQNVYGKELVFSDRRFQKAREMWGAAILILGRQKLLNDGEEYWLAPCYDEVPDVFAYKFEQHPTIPDGQRKVQMNIEMTELLGHTNEKLHERVLSKIKGKAYPKYFVLGVHIRKPGAVDLDAEYAEIQKQGVPFMEAWATGSVIHEDPHRQMMIGLGSPKVGLEFGLKEALLENKKQVPGMLLTEMRTRGTDTSIEPEMRRFEFPSLT